MILKLGLVIDVALKVLHLNMHRHKTYKRPAWPCNVLAQKLQLLCRNICSFVCYFCYLMRYPAMLLFSCALSLILNMQIKIPIQYNIVNTCSFYVDIHTIYIFTFISFLRISPYGMALEMDTSVSFDFCWTPAFRKIDFFETHFVLNWLNNT